MKKQDNRLAFSVVATLITGIALVYTLIMFPKIIFAVAGISIVFIAAAFILTQNILSYGEEKEKERNHSIQESIDYMTTKMETMDAAQSQINKATFLYTKQVAKSLSTLENNYIESQEALYKNLSEISNTQNKSTKLMLKYNQNSTTKMIASLKDLRNHLSETMIQGFDQIQPNNQEIVDTLEDIVDYLKTQSQGMEQSMGIQLNNVAHELQNISNNIQKVQVSIPAMPQVVMQPVTAPVTQEASAPEVTAPGKQEASAPEVTATGKQDVSALDVAASGKTEDITPTKDDTSVLAKEDEILSTTENNATSTTSKPVVQEDFNSNDLLSQDDVEALFNALSSDMDTAKETADTIEENTEPLKEETTTTKAFEPVQAEPISDDPNKQLSPDEIAALFAAAEPTPKKTTVEEVTKENDVMEEEKPFTPTFTVVGKEEAKEALEDTTEEEMSASTDDPNRQLSPDEIAALFAAADPAPKKAEKAPEPVKIEPISDDPNKQLSPDEIAALFAAAEPSPKKEEVKEEPIATKAPAAPAMDDPNKMLSPDEIAALFASMG